MRIIEIIENELISLDQDCINQLEEIKALNNDLPFIINDSKLITENYIIGEIQLDGTLIRINPRHKALSLSHFFEMLLYIDGFNNDSQTTGNYSFVSGFGIDALIENFLITCAGLVQFGITGIFDVKSNNTFSLNGRLVSSKYVQKLIPIEGLFIESEYYELNNNVNRIIKSALIKLLEYSKIQSLHRNTINRLLDYFQLIDEYIVVDESSIRNDISKFNSTNPHYGICLEYALKILLNFRVGYSNNGGIQWNAFLENSNDIFEKYVRTILERELENNVRKFEQPVNFAKINVNGIDGLKSYSPDIVIDYDSGSARAVFDVKNKKFDPNIALPSDLVEVGDIYQLLFYANQLSSSVCGLIYPSGSHHEPIIVDLLGIDTRFFLLGINMNNDFHNRKNELISDLKYCLKFT